MLLATHANSFHSGRPLNYLSSAHWPGKGQSSKEHASTLVPAPSIVHARPTRVHGSTHRAQRPRHRVRRAMAAVKDRYSHYHPSLYVSCDWCGLQYRSTRSRNGIHNRGYVASINSTALWPSTDPHSGYVTSAYSVCVVLVGLLNFVEF